MKKIFISYRRHDSQWPADGIYKALQLAAPRGHVFMDVDSIPLGADFVEILERWVGECEIMLALIGAGWINAVDPATGRRRLDDPHDFVRIEIREALRRGIPVVPVLIDGAPMPGAADLPDDLRSLVRRQAEFVQLRTFDADVARLMRKLGVGAADAAPAAPQPGGAERKQQAEEQRLRAEGRIPVLVGDRKRSETRWLLPGGSEPFCDIDGGPEMVVVPAGRFMMGSPDDEPRREEYESPRHEVTFARPFAVGRHAVTRGQLAAFVEATSHKKSGGWFGFGKRDQWRNPDFSQDDNHPVVRITWEDAKAYAAWLKEITGQPYRLLTEAEWEYAARAGTATPFWWGSSITPAEANYDGNFVYKGGGSKGAFRKGTVPAGSFQPSPWGLYNVHGNVWEWCDDTWHENYNGAPTDGSPWVTANTYLGRVVRGGSWLSSPGVVRSAQRSRCAVENSSIGFRLARRLSS
jgi:formylglycine-generating enzyme required for sulfatase activity